MDNKVDLGLAGRSIVVTGAASGIGRAVALALAATGARLTLGDIDEDGLAETVRLAGSTTQIRVLRTDVTAEAELQALVAAAVEAYGALDGAANVAGLQPSQKLLTETEWHAWRKCVDVNLGGAFFAMKHQIRAMVENGRPGAIVNVSSNTAIAGAPYMADYTGAKAGLVGLARVAVREYGLKGIRINTVLPGPVETPMLRRLIEAMPQVEGGTVKTVLPGRIAHPDEVAHAVRWLLSTEASFVNGACLTVDGGMTT